MKAPDLLPVALNAHAAGLCVMPPREDTSKRPDGTWERFQLVRSDEDQIRRWYKNGRTGLGVICGQVSGNVEMLELEGVAVKQGLSVKLAEACKAAGIGHVLDRLLHGYLETTPRGGVHFLFKCDEIDRNEVLAAYIDEEGKTKPLIETRGEGGFTVIAPSYGNVHENGKPWVLVAGSFATIPTLTPDERRELFAVCRSLGRRPQRTESEPSHARESSTDATWDPFTPPGSDPWMADVIADFNERTEWQDVLAGHFESNRTKDGIEYWHYRDAEHEQSATTNATGRDTLLVFSSSAVAAGWPPQPSSLDRFGAHTFIIMRSHDKSARVEVARRLRDDGYGPQTPTAGAGSARSHRATEQPRLPADFWNERAALAHIRRAAHARLISADAVLGAVIARVVASTHHHVTIPAIVGRVSGLEQYVALVAGPGGGKGSACDTAAELIENVPLDPRRAGELIERNIGSGEGFVRCFFTVEEVEGDDGKKRRVTRQTIFNALFTINEAETLARLARRQDQTISPILREAWSWEALGASYADQTKNLRIPAHRYRLAVIMGVQPTLARFLLDDAGAGTPQRFVWFTALDPDLPDEAPDWPGRLPWRPPEVGLLDIARCDIAIDASIRAEVVAARRAQVRGTAAADNLGGHANLVRLKLAATLAILDERLDVNPDDWRLAGIIEQTSCAVRDHTRQGLTLEDYERAEREARRAGRHREAQLEAEDAHADAAIERVAGVIARRCRRDGTEPVSGSDLRRALSARDRGDFSAALDLAAERGWIIRQGDRWTPGGGQ